MSVIKTENLDVYALVDKDQFIVSVLLEGQTLATFEYNIMDLAKDVVASLGNDRGVIEDEDADDAYDTVDAFEKAADYINEYIED